MNPRSILDYLVFLVGAVLTLGATPAQATLNMDTVPSSAYQFGTGSGVYLGHTVIAGTNLNRLIAGGSFRATCAANMYTGEITGARTLTSNLIGQYNRLTVTIPESLPALRNMPGFVSAPRGTRLECQYAWTSHAEEPVYTVGLPGFSVTLGGERLVDSGVVTFWMRKPGTATGDDDACIP
jgi:hypothetical protein